MSRIKWIRRLSVFLAVPLLLLAWPEMVMAGRVIPDMVPVEGGCFEMGDSFGEGDEDEKPLHEVCLDDFFIGRFEVTQEQWETLMGSNPSRFSKGADYPVENVSWDEVQVFIARLNNLAGGGYRLPTEAEWEYACRSGGRNEKYCGGENLEDYCRFSGNSGYASNRIGTRFPNSLGIYDMSGNVWEWVADWYGKNYYRVSPQRNPTGPEQGFFRVSRGGSWDYGPWFSRSSARLWSWPELSYFGLGFRLARTPEAEDKTGEEQSGNQTSTSLRPAPAMPTNP